MIQTQKDANNLIRNIDSLDHLQRGYLEQYLIINKPTRNLYLLVDKLFEYAYTSDGMPMIVGEIETFNCKAGKCIFYHPCNLMYYGSIDDSYDCGSYYAYTFRVHRLCEKRIKEYW